MSYRPMGCVALDVALISRAVFGVR